jgi:hypothetical protein
MSRTFEIFRACGWTTIATVTPGAHNANQEGCPMRTIVAVALALTFAVPVSAQEEDPESYEPDPPAPAAVTGATPTATTPPAVAPPAAPSYGYVAPPPCPQANPCPQAPPPCGCCAQPCVKKLMRSDLFPPLAVEPAPAERVMGSAAKGAMIAGAAMLAFGEVLNAFYIINGGNTMGITTLLPVVGPAAAVFHDRPGPEWATPLLVSTWVQAAGILMMAVAAGHSEDEEHLPVYQKVRISAGTATGRDGHVSVSVRF